MTGISRLIIRVCWLGCFFRGVEPRNCKLYYRGEEERTNHSACLSCLLDFWTIIGSRSTDSLFLRDSRSIIDFWCTVDSSSSICSPISSAIPLKECIFLSLPVLSDPNFFSLSKGFQPTLDPSLGFQRCKTSRINFFSQMMFCDFTKPTRVHAGWLSRCAHTDVGMLRSINVEELRKAASIVIASNSTLAISVGYWDVNQCTNDSMSGSASPRKETAMSVEVVVSVFNFRLLVAKIQRQTRLNLLSLQISAPYIGPFARSIQTHIQDLAR